MENRPASIVVRFKPTSLTAATYDDSAQQLREDGVDPRPESLDRHICFGTKFEAFGERLRELPVLAELGIGFSAPPEILDVHEIVER